MDFKDESIVGTISLASLGRLLVCTDESDPSSIVGGDDTAARFLLVVFVSSSSLSPSVMVPLPVVPTGDEDGLGILVPWWRSVVAMAVADLVVLMLDAAVVLGLAVFVVFIVDVGVGVGVSVVVGGGRGGRGK